MTPLDSPERRSACPLNASLEVFGDRWSLLIVRDLMFRGRSSYGDFLGAEEGIATNVLADRLQRLEREGILAKHRAEDDARRVVYRLTEKGLDLAPVLIEMIVWGARYEETAAPPDIVRAMTTDREAFIAELRRGLLAAGATRAGASKPPRTARRSRTTRPASAGRVK